MSHGHAPHAGPTIRTGHPFLQRYLPSDQARPGSRSSKSLKYPSINPQIIFFLAHSMLTRVVHVQQVALTLLGQEAPTRRLRKPQGLHEVAQRGPTHLEMPSWLTPTAKEHQLRQRVPPTGEPAVERAVGQCLYHARRAVLAEFAPEYPFRDGSELPVDRIGQAECECPISWTRRRGRVSTRCVCPTRTSRTLGSAGSVSLAGSHSYCNNAGVSRSDGFLPSCIYMCMSWTRGV